MGDLDRKLTIVTELPAYAVNALRAGDRFRILRKSARQERSDTYRVIIEVERLTR